MKRVKILQFPVAASKGGITQYVMRNWEYIDKERFLFDFATMNSKLDFEAELKKYGSNVYHIPVYAEDDPKGFEEAFWKILKDGQYDVVHLHTKQWKSFTMERLAKEARVRRIIIHAHSAGIEAKNEEQREKEEKLHYSCLEKLDNSLATDYWSCSEAASRWLYGNKIPRDEIVLLPNAVDTNRFSYDANKRTLMRRELGLRDDFVLGFVGRLEEVKNPGFLLDIFGEIVRRYVNSRLLIVGEGSLRDYLEQRCIKEDLLDAVRFVGRRTNVEDYMMAMDMLLLPSVFEGFPITLVEAQCAGLKCVCSKGVSEETDITDDILHIDTRDYSAWVGAIEGMMKDGYIRRSNRQRLIDRGFDIYRQIKKVEELYTK